MSLAQRDVVSSGGGVSCRGRGSPSSFHRLAEVRQREGISRRTVARRLKTTVAAVKAMEETDDLPLSQLYAWQKALRVPIEELLVENNGPLSGPVLKRARMVRLMKTASAIFHWTRQKSIRRMAHMLIEQLVELMPELADIGPWHTHGKRRRRDELGAAFHRQMSSQAWSEVLRQNQ